MINLQIWNSLLKNVIWRASKLLLQLLDELIEELDEEAWKEE